MTNHIDGYAKLYGIIRRSDESDEDLRKRTLSALRAHGEKSKKDYWKKVRKLGRPPTFQDLFGENGILSSDDKKRGD